MPSCRRVSPRSGFIPLTGAALAISLGTIVRQASAVQQELEMGQPLAVYAQLQEGLTSLGIYSLARGCSGNFTGDIVCQASAVQQELDVGQQIAVYAQLQEGLTSLGIYSLDRGCSGNFTGDHSVSGLCSTARTGYGPATSGVCPVAGGSHLARDLFPCPGLLWQFHWGP